jgi:transposase
VPDAHALPDDVDHLKRLVLEQKREIEHLKIQLARFRRWKFGRSSEQMDLAITQIELSLTALQALVPEQPVFSSSPATREARVTPVRRHRPARRALPAHLPRETVVHVSPEVRDGCACKDCGGKLRKLSEDIGEVLELVPASFKVIRHVREKHSCCRCSRIVQQPAPSRPIERGLPGPALLAHVLNGKYGHHLPLYRQSEIFARAGVSLDRSRLAQWVGAASRLMNPLIEALGRYVMSADRLHADDTPMPVLDPGRGRVKRGYLWSYVRDERPFGGTDPPAVWFAYSPDRKGEHPQRHLRAFAGLLQTDAYAGFNALLKLRSKSSDSAGRRITRVLCMAHARRHFHDLYVALKLPIAREAIERIGELYGIEREIKGLSPEQRREERQTHSVPRLKILHEWLELTLRQVARRSALAKAIRYMLKPEHWQSLTYYCEDGHADIDNSAAERSIRPIALGRRNFLFCGSDAGGERAAAMYSLIGSARLNGIEPEGYLRGVIERIADHPINRVEELLPWNVKQTSPTAHTAPADDAKESHGHAHIAH